MFGAINYNRRTFQDVYLFTKIKKTVNLQQNGNLSYEVM